MNSEKPGWVVAPETCTVLDPRARVAATNPDALRELHSQIDAEIEKFLGAWIMLVADSLSIEFNLGKSADYMRKVLRQVCDAELLVAAGRAAEMVRKWDR